MKNIKIFFSLQCLAMIICISSTAQTGGTLFIENADKFPSNDLFVFSRVQVPWTRDSVYYNANHDSIAVRIHNRGRTSLIIRNISHTGDTTWKLRRLGSREFSSVVFPLSVAPGTYTTLTTKFVAKDVGTRVKIVRDTVSITTSDSFVPVKQVYFSGLWQRRGEDRGEPYAQEIITAFGLKTKTGFTSYNYSKTPKGDEIPPYSYYQRADNSAPVTIRQMSAYHGCCTFTERIQWYKKDSTVMNTVFTHLAKDAQSLLPRKTSGGAATGSFSYTGAFGFKVGTKDYTDTMLTPGRKIGIRVWKAINSLGVVIPNAYIIANDYLGTQYTNYDYNDNMYYVTNIKPDTIKQAAKPAPKFIIPRKRRQSAEAKGLEYVSVYPNPVGKVFRIKYSDNRLYDSNLQIIDISGKIYNLPVRLQMSNMQVDVSGLALRPGFYFLRIVPTTGPVEIIKLIVS